MCHDLYSNNNSFDNYGTAFERSGLSHGQVYGYLPAHVASTTASKTDALVRCVSPSQSTLRAHPTADTTANNMRNKLTSYTPAITPSFHVFASRRPNFFPNGQPHPNRQRQHSELFIGGNNQVSMHFCKQTPHVKLRVPT